MTDRDKFQFAWMTITKQKSHGKPMGRKLTVCAFGTKRKRKGE